MKYLRNHIIFLRINFFLFWYQRKSKINVSYGIGGKNWAEKKSNLKLTTLVMTSTNVFINGGPVIWKVAIDAFVGEGASFSLGKAHHFHCINTANATSVSFNERHYHTGVLWPNATTPLMIESKNATKHRDHIVSFFAFYLRLLKKKATCLFL